MVDFLEVTLNVTDSTYEPYHKPNDEIVIFIRNRNKVDFIETGRIVTAHLLP